MLAVNQASLYKSHSQCTVHCILLDWVENVLTNRYLNYNSPMFFACHPQIITGSSTVFPFRNKEDIVNPRRGRTTILLQVICVTCQTAVADRCPSIVYHRVIFWVCWDWMEFLHIRQHRLFVPSLDPCRKLQPTMIKEIPQPHVKNN